MTRTRGPAAFLPLSLMLACAAGAETLKVPLQLGFPQVAREAAGALGMDEDGTVLIERSKCSRVRLSDLRVESAAPNARVSVAFDADLGTRIFKRCIGPRNAEGRLRVLLEPRVADQGLAIELKILSAELRRADGTTGLLTRPARLLAEKVVLPRLENIRVDLAQPLTAVDELIRTFAGHEAPLLTERSSLAAVTVGDSTVEAIITLELAPPSGQPAPEAALSDEELQQWARVEDELDGFLSTAIIALASATDNRPLQLDLLAALLDARLAITRALVDEHDDAVADPIRDLFVASWDQIRPAVLELEESGSVFPGLRLTAFMAGADAIAALDALGPEYGIEISRDGIRRLARMLLADEAPVSFTPLALSIDPDLVGLFGLGTAVPQDTGPLALGWLDWLLPAARAADSPAGTDPTGLTPRASGLDAYLALVAERLVDISAEKLRARNRLPEPVTPLFTPLVLATAWKESCWRHYLNEEQPPEVIRSSIGAVGMMQINGRVWRGLYDLDRLEREMDYNIGAGVEILEHYLVDYAIRRGEHEHPGGQENLARATYAAYNGGPRHLSRYREDETRPRLRAIDRSFWEHFEQIRTSGFPEVRSCYAVGTKTP